MVQQQAAMLSNSAKLGEIRNHGLRNFCGCGALWLRRRWRGYVMGLIRVFIQVVALLIATGAASAQNPALDGSTEQRLDTTHGQRQIIYQSISKAQKNNAAPTGFRAAVGAVVPNGITLAPVPATVVELLPQTKGLESALVEGQVVLVEPKSKRVVAVIVQEP